MERTPAESVAEPLVVNPLLDVVGDAVMSVRGADVGANRERQRRRRLWKLAVVAGIPAAWLWWRWVEGRPFDLLRLPHIDPFFLVIVLFFGVMTLAMVGQFVFARRSPHVVFRPEQIDVRMNDVVGIAAVKEEVIRSLNLFLSHKAFAGQMGGTPRRGLLFEGAPGTGKTHLAKAMAAEAGVPFLFVSATSFQSMWYGATAGKIKSYFKAVRKAARAEGGAIAFIEEIDAIATTRGGMNGMTAASDPMKMVTCCGSISSLPATYLAPAGNLVQNQVAVEGVGGVVNELLVQLQSFDDPTGMQKLYSKVVGGLNLLLPLDRQISKPKPQSANVLVIAATNRADSLDPALLRPGRFDRRLSFELPDKRGRRELIDHFLDRKSHHEEIDDERRDALASITHGYTPVMIEHLFDEALVNAVRRGDNAMTWRDVERARLTEEVGLGQPVGYTDHEKRLIATHEAGHATAAYLVAPTRRLEVLSIIKRREALGLLAHGDADEVFTRSRSEMLSLIQISLAGQCAEEIFFGDVSTGPGGDLLYATNVAAQMVGAAGMTSTLISYAAVQNSAFSDTNLVGRVLADPDGRQRVEDLLQEQKVVIKAQLESNAHLVAALRDELLLRNELIGKEIKGVLDAARAAEALEQAEQPSSIPVEPAASVVVDLRDQTRRRTVVSPTEPTAGE